MGFGPPDDLLLPPQDIRRWPPFISMARSFCNFAALRSRPKSIPYSGCGALAFRADECDTPRDAQIQRGSGGRHAMLKATFFIHQFISSHADAGTTDWMRSGQMVYIFDPQRSHASRGRGYAGATTAQPRMISVVGMVQRKNPMTSRQILARHRPHPVGTPALSARDAVPST